MSTTAQDIIKSYIGASNGTHAQTASKPGATRPTSANPKGFGLLQGDTMAAIQKRMEKEAGPVEKARENRSGGKVDAAAMRRDILGSSLATKARAQTKFRSQNVSKAKPYVKVADRGIL